MPNISLESAALLNTLLDDIAIAKHHHHSRWRVYPQDVSSTKTLAADAAANTFGDWAEIIPLNTVPFSYDVIGLVIESVSAATTYHIQLGYSTDDNDPTTNNEAGERRVRLVTVPIARATELLHIAGQGISANAKLWGRLKTASTNADTCEVSVVLTRHIDTSHTIAKYGAFPW